MNQRKQLTLWLLVALAGVAGYTYYRGQARQAALLQAMTGLTTQLTANNQQVRQANEKTLKWIRQQVCLNHNQASDRAVLLLAEQIQARTNSLADSLHALGQQLRRANGEAATGALRRPAARSAFDQVSWLFSSLEAYRNFVRVFTPSAASFAAFEASPSRPEWFRAHYQQDASLAAALANLMQFETQICLDGTEALQNQAQKVGSGCDLCFTRIGAWAVPVAETVAPGADYRAQLYLATLTGGYYGRQIIVNGQALKNDARYGPGEVVLVAPPRPRRAGQPDTVHASWQGTIRVHGCPNDTVFQAQVPYLIVSPN